MAVAILETDTWINHLPFTGQRPSAYGPIDGIWYGVISGAGDASGGNIALNGRISFDRKEDWIYILGGADISLNSDTDMEAFIQANTGPLIPTTTAVVNPTFNWGGQLRAQANNATAILAGTTGNSGPGPFNGMPIFGDKRIAGIFLMLAAGFETNLNFALYTLSAWGFLIRYQSFFRDQPAARG